MMTGSGYSLKTVRVLHHIGTSFLGQVESAGVSIIKKGRRAAVARTRTLVRKRGRCMGSPCEARPGPRRSFEASRNRDALSFSMRATRGASAMLGTHGTMRRFGDNPIRRDAHHGIA